MSADPHQAPRPLPDRPNRRHLKDQARDLVKAGTARSITAARFEIARLHGFPSWPKLKAYVESFEVPGHYERPDEYVECTPLGYALRFPDEPPRSGKGGTVAFLRERGAIE